MANISLKCKYCNDSIYDGEIPSTNLILDCTKCNVTFYYYDYNYVNKHNPNIKLNYIVLLCNDPYKITLDLNDQKVHLQKVKLFTNDIKYTEELICITYDTEEVNPTNKEYWLDRLLKLVVFT